MKRLILLTAAAAVFLSCAGDKVFVKAVDSCTKVILPEYKTYVAKDTSLDSTSIRIRTQTCTELQKLIDSEMIK